MIPVGYLRSAYYRLMTRSARSALREQGLARLAETLVTLVPDVSDQYTTHEVTGPYLETTVRGLHAFQISLVNAALSKVSNPFIVDMGDSAGTHLTYLLGLHGNGSSIRTLSVNMDEKAIERIHRRGLNAVKGRAEDLHALAIDADIFLRFETLEHLCDPCRFLHRLASETKAQYLVITVPYVRRSRIGLHHIRRNLTGRVTAENTHLFELSPDDWKLLLRHSGWEAFIEKVYLQYPRRGIFRITKPLWRRRDFEGFYGAVLRKESAWSSLYTDWQAP